MYCERCNIDFPERLRYCKWCGGALKDRTLDTSELKTCPSCKAAVKANWTFCKSCGAKLGSPAIVGTSPVGSQSPPESSGACSNCGEQLDATSLYCKGCGSPVQQTAAPYGASSLLCAVCNSYSSIGSVVCTVCGAAFAGSAQQRPDRAPNTLIDVDESSGALPDLKGRPSQAGLPVIKEGTAEMASRPVEENTDEEQSTRKFSSPETIERIAPVAPPPAPPAPDDMRTIVMGSIKMPSQSDPQAIKPETSEITASGPVAADVPPEDEQVTMISGGGEAWGEKVAETTVLDRGRTTSPVDEDRQEEGPIEADVTTRPISDLKTYVDTSGQTASKFEGPVASDGTDSLGTAPEGGPTWPESFQGGTGVIGSGAPKQPPPPPQSLTESPTREIHEPDPAKWDPQTAPFGLDPFPSPPQPAPPPQQPWPQQPNMPPPADAPETRMMPPPPLPVPPQPGLPLPGPAAQPSRSNLVAILSVVVGIMILVLAGLGAWWYLSGGERKTPAPQEEVAVTPQPATEPAPPTAPQPPPGPVVPEGMVLVPAGAYIIGRNDGDALASPQRTVDLAAFYIDTTEVTNAQYMLFVDARKRQPPPGWENGTYPQDRANWPVTGVSWQDASDYAAWAGKRLPTEVEWEAAARGTDGRLFPWGNEWKRGLANIGTGGIRETGQYRQGASPFGALDMLGNVWEWTADELALYPGSTSQLPDAVKPGITYRIIRGGAYDGSKENDASYRGFVDASQGYPKTGFRCVMDAR